jgi:hypothetical protein
MKPPKVANWPSHFGGVSRQRGPHMNSCPHASLVGLSGKTSPFFAFYVQAGKNQAGAGNLKAAM